MSLRKQATSLAIIHAADLLQPLLILPYAGRVLGPLHFGRYAYAMSIGQLAATIVDYGFHLTAQRAAAPALREPAAIASLFAEVVVTKALLCVGVTLAGFAAADALAISKPMFVCAILTAAAGNVLFPSWLFIALERAWQAAVAVVVARSLALVCFLTMVTSPIQIEFAVAIQSSVPLVSGAVSLPFIVPVGFAGFRSMTLSRVGSQLRNGWRGFLFTLVESVSMTLPVPLVAHFDGYVIAGQYSVAEKFVSATRPFLRVILETLLPRVAYYVDHDPEAGFAFIWNSSLTLVVGAMLSLFLFLAAPPIIIIVFGDRFSGAIPIVRVMSIIPFLLNANIFTSTLYMFNCGHEAAWAVLNVFSFLIFLIVAYLSPLPLQNAGISVAVAVIAKEGVVLVVSAGFFLVYGATKAGTFRLKA
jgi:O-antigen/teichoic acid export membrane protein